MIGAHAREASAQQHSDAQLESASAAATATGGAAGRASFPERQSLDDAWWTGPLLAPSAATLPRGHFLIEPYLYDVTAPHSNGYGSLTYANYGVTDKLTVGVIPTFGYNVVGNGPNSSGVGPGDTTAQAQYRLTQFEPDSWVPTTSIVIQESLPTGKFDRLGNHPADGLGGGTYTTTLGFYSQMYFWLPNGRILRTRFDVSRAFPGSVDVHDVSVYGTAQGFRGRAKPGDSLYFDSSWEYSLTRSWVLALDITYQHDDSTRVNGRNIPDPAAQPAAVRIDSGSSSVFGVAPAIEYSWADSLGVIFGVRVIPAHHNLPATVTPAVAINYVH
jgi:hypothetical protein